MKEYKVILKYTQKIEAESDEQAMLELQRRVAAGNTHGVSIYVSAINDPDYIDTDRDGERAVLKAAQKFVHHPETMESYEEIKGSNSMDFPVEFADLCYHVLETYGGPVKE